MALGLLSYVISLAFSSESLDLILEVIEKAWFIALIFAIPYLLGRFIVWERLLKELKVSAPKKPVIVSFLVGEVSKTLPMGIYLESFLLNNLTHLNKNSQTKSYLATTAMLALESILAIPTVLVVGIPGFHWLRLVVSLVVLFWITLLGSVWLLLNKNILPVHSKIYSKIRRLTLDFFKEVHLLINFKSLLLLLPTFIYLLAYSSVLYMVIHLTGLGSVTFLQSITVFAFILIATILIPVPTELGIVEFSGLEALVALGISSKEAAAMMLGLRIIFTGAIFLLSGLVFVFLHPRGTMGG